MNRNGHSKKEWKCREQKHCNRNEDCLWWSNQYSIHVTEGKSQWAWKCVSRNFQNWKQRGRKKKKTGNNHREITGLSIQNCPDTQKEKQVSNRIIQRKEIGKETEEILETMKRISPNNVKHQSQLQIALAMLS